MSATLSPVRAAHDADALTINEAAEVSGWSPRMLRRLREEPLLGAAVDIWLDQTPEPPAEVDRSDWLDWEQEKHKRLLESTDF
ncbi:MAG: hypothetical protein HZB14_02220 [Actinobacteria bacterium]|nr:hypothetical protein [Actinomycetota bacterium]